MVERFQMNTEHGWICARPDEKGDWVRYADYAELAAENERLQARNLEHEMRLEAEEAKSEYWKNSASTGAVKVKALEWHARPGVDGTFDAYTEIGHFIVTITDDERGMWFLVGMTQSNYCEPDMGIVKAAAQADYERRILSALEPSARETSTVDSHEATNVRDKPGAPKDQQPPEQSAPKLCDDEGCPHYGTPHVCVERSIASEGRQDTRHLTLEDQQMFDRAWRRSVKVRPVVEDSDITAYVRENRHKLYEDISQSAALEGQQEPVAFRWRNTIDPTLWNVGFAHQAPSHAELEPLYTRPAEQAVTEAMVDRVLDAAGDYMGMQYGNTALHHPTDRARIKAAMEVGR